MADEQNATKTNVMNVVTDIRISQGRLKAEYAEVTFAGDVEVKKLEDKYFTLIKDGLGYRFR